MQTTPLVAGLAVGAAAYGAKAAISAWQAFSKAGPRMRQFYKGGFLPEMTRREAALILGEAAGWSVGQGQESGSRSGLYACGGVGRGGGCSTLCLP